MAEFRYRTRSLTSMTLNVNRFTVTTRTDLPDEFTQLPILDQADALGIAVAARTTFLNVLKRKSVRPAKPSFPSRFHLTGSVVETPSEGGW
jgi:hypothetical protein